MFRERAGYCPQFQNAEGKHQIFHLVERFQQAPLKIAIQKDGELTRISQSILLQELGVSVPQRNPEERRLLDVSQDGTYGFLHARNKDLCDLVARGNVDLVVVGTDRLVEAQVNEQVIPVASYNRDEWTWPIVIATAENSGITGLEQIKRIATQYPVIAEQFFQSIGQKVDIIRSSGGTEVYPYLGADAIIDLTSTGTSLLANGLTRWEPPIFTVFPVMIVNPKSIAKYLQCKKSSFQVYQSFFTRNM